MAVATAPALSLPLDPETVERLAVGRNEPDWLRDLRLAAARDYAALTWPTGAEEEWRRFPLAGLPGLGSPPVVRAQGGYTATYSATPAGVAAGKLTQMSVAHPTLVRPWLERPGAIASHAPFAALARAMWSGGSTFLHVSGGTLVREPIIISNHWEAGANALIARTIIVLEPGSSATVVEELTSDGGGPGRLAIPQLDVHLGAGARLRYVRTQRFGDDVWDLSSQRYVSERESELASFNVLTGARKAKVGVESDIRADGANVKLYGLVAAGAEQRIDVNSFQRLDGKGSNSDLLYLSALYDAAKAIFYGIIRVEPTSSGTGSYQECRNMLLSPKAGADPIPVLEILTNDVARCGHGATAGAIEDSELFYVMSRGLTHDAAEKLLVRGFFQRVIDHLPDPRVRALIVDALASRIGRLAELEDVA
ncbi:MAG TPA: SufD family Fe-S cluster assembly protein [Candidatus Limnocylindria bacterium]|nr:SufD family Fe-S cluster assembly protein [Candidatus Limnocylindria bacterium]